MATDIIIHDKKDNVGVVVIEKITPQQDCACWIMEDDSSTNIQSVDEIPLGHKIAMTDLNEGDTILKYGHDIGKVVKSCLLYTSPSPRDGLLSRMPSSA